MPAMMRSLSPCFDATRTWRRTERANLEKKFSIGLSQELGSRVKMNWQWPSGRVASLVKVSHETFAE